ncbi:TonB-dependent receptor [Xanthomonas hortorum pv. pelargonii]|nr:TonB-dependent receptor [Xanthomonas hortorum pv. pelargonii]
MTYPFAINRRGTPDLDAELGNSWTAGFVWDAFENVSFTADFWRIHLEDEIRDIDETTILRDEAGCRTWLTITPGQAWSNPGGADYCASILARVQRGGSGLDLSARCQLQDRHRRFPDGARLHQPALDARANLPHRPQPGAPRP